MFPCTDRYGEHAQQPAFGCAIRVARGDRQFGRLEQALAVLDRRLSRLLPFDAMAVFLFRDDRLALAYGSAMGAPAVSGLEIPVGQAIARRIAETRRPAFNLDPGVEAGPNGPSAR